MRNPAKAGVRGGQDLRSAAGRTRDGPADRSRAARLPCLSGPDREVLAATLGSRFPSDLCPAPVSLGGRFLNRAPSRKRLGTDTRMVAILRGRSMPRRSRIRWISRNAGHLRRLRGSGDRDAPGSAPSRRGRHPVRLPGRRRESMRRRGRVRSGKAPILARSAWDRESGTRSDPSRRWRAHAPDKLRALPGRPGHSTTSRDGDPVEARGRPRPDPRIEDDRAQPVPRRDRPGTIRRRVAESDSSAGGCATTSGRSLPGPGRRPGTRASRLRPGTRPHRRNPANLAPAPVGATRSAGRAIPSGAAARARRPRPAGGTPIVRRTRWTRAIRPATGLLPFFPPRPRRAGSRSGRGSRAGSPKRRRPRTACAVRGRLFRIRRRRDPRDGIRTRGRQRAARTLLP